MQEPEPVVINIAGNGKIMSFSAAAEELFGWPAAEVLGMPITRLLPRLPDKKITFSPGGTRASDEPGRARPRHMRGICKDGLTIDLKVSVFPWQTREQAFTTLLIDAPDAAESYVASLLDEIELVQEVALWAGLPAVIDRAAGWFERAHPGSRMWLQVSDAQGKAHVATSPTLPKTLASLLERLSPDHLMQLTRSTSGAFTEFFSDTVWPTAIRQAAIVNELYFGGIRLIRLHGQRPVGALAVFCPEHPREVHHVHALDKATELVILAAELGRAEQRAREARAGFSALLNAAVDAIIVIDEDAKIVTFNAAAERIFGYHARDVLGRNVNMLMPEPYRTQHDSFIRGYLASREPKVIGIGRELTARRKDGGTFPVELAIGEVRLDNRCRFVGIVRDITYRRETENLLRQQEQELWLTLQNAPLGIMSLDRHGHFLNINQAFCDMLGYSESELRRMNAAALIHPDHVEEFVKHLHQAFNGSFRSGSLEAKYICKNGHEIYGILHSSVVNDNRGRPLRLVAQVEDITRRIRLEEEARHNRERLAHLTRITTLGEMAAGIAHEINQPLTAIASYSQACRRRLQAGDTNRNKLLDLLEKINDQALRAGEVIKGLRALVKKRESRQEVVDLNELIHSSVTLAKVDTRLLNCKIALELVEPSPAVIADAVQIQQIILNLIRNGIDAMETVPAHGRVISLRTALHDDEQVEIAVADRGPGLSREIAEQLFNPFFTTKASGMGMGLAISRSIITSHGGRLWFSQNVPNGAIFHFTLPLNA